MPFIYLFMSPLFLYHKLLTIRMDMSTDKSQDRPSRRRVGSPGCR
jgi:hypothetical protein